MRLPRPVVLSSPGLEERLTARAMDRMARQGGLDPLVERIAARETDPYSAVEEVLRKLGL